MVILQLIGALIVYFGIFVILTIVLKIFTKKKALPLIGTALVGSTAFMTLLFFIGYILHLIFKPVEPDRDDIIGHYVIARSKWPGKNADWQHKTYTLEINSNHAIIRDARTKTIWKYRIEWSQVHEHLWGFADYTERHHLIANGPTLYRERFGHYYVFESPLYGNVFFERE